jgi:hypothetical protein
MKRTKNQVGGGDFHHIDLKKGGPGETRSNNLRAAIENSNLLPEIKLKIGRWFSPDWGNEKDKAADLETYFTAIERQDEIFDIVVDKLKELYNATQVEDIINGATQRNNENLEEAILYIKDIEQFLLFKKDYSKSSGVSKLDTIYNPALKETLSELLYFPKRLNNIFIQSLANVLILFKNDPDSKDLNDVGKRAIAVANYKSNMYANVYLLTGHSFRDGFYLDQDMDDFNKIMETFWDKLFTSISSDKDTTEFINDGDSDNYAYIADEVFRWFTTYKRKEGQDHKPDLIKYMMGKFAVLDPAVMNDDDKKAQRVSLPPDSYDAVEIYGTQIGTILKKMDNTTLEFIIHLAYTLLKNEEATSKAISGTE